MTTSYPNNYDSFPLPNSSDKTGGGLIRHAEQHRNMGDSIEAIEATLGLRPQGPYTTVDERLDAIESGAITIDASTLNIVVSASDVAVIDVGGHYIGTNVEQVLQEIGTYNFSGAVSSVNNQTGDVVLNASEIDVFDTANYWAGTTIEAILQEIGAEGIGGVSSINGETGTVTIDAGDINIIDSGGLFTATKVESALVELRNATKQEVVQMEIFGEGEYIATGSSIVSFRMPWAATLVGLRAYVKGVSLSGPIVMRLLNLGSDMLSPQLSIDEGEYSSVTAVTPTVPNYYVNDDTLIDFDVVSPGDKALGPLVVILYFAKN